ncbi:MAG: hypothetical protein ACI97A_003879 [Planctomycetota bacterium]|jgi:hypothetical protein
MQRINSIMLSALMLAGLCLHAIGQEAEIEVIELKPGIKLKKTGKTGVHRLKKKHDGKPHVMTFKTDGGEARYEVIIDDAEIDSQIIELGNGSQAIIRIETIDKKDAATHTFEWNLDADGDEDDLFIVEEEDEIHEEDGGFWFTSKSDPGSSGAILEHFTNMGEGAIKHFAGDALKHLSSLERLHSLKDHNWQGIAKDAMKHLGGKFEIKVDGHNLDLMEFLGENGVDLGKLHSADDIHVFMGDRDFHFPMKMGKSIYGMLHGDKADKGDCCCCCCGNAKAKKSKKSMAFSLAPKGGHPQTLFGHKLDPKTPNKLHLKRSTKTPQLRWATPKVQKNSSRFWSKKAPKAKKNRAFRLDTPHKRKAPKSKKSRKVKKNRTLYFSDAPSSKSKSKSKAKAHGFGMGTTQHPGEHPFGGRVRLHREEKGGQIATRLHLLGDDDDDEDHHDDDDLEDHIMRLERQVKRLRKELNSLKKNL